mgnify:CR=1 FL=1
MALNFVPSLPQAQPINYGQGYGNWQQYAGFGKKNFDQPSVEPVAPPAPVSPMVAPPPVAPDYSLIAKPPIAPSGSMAAPSGSMAAPSGLGTQDLNTLVKQAEKYDEEF